MAKQTIAYLKNLFTTGKRPTQQHFWDWLDSFVHKDDQVTATTDAINQAIDNSEAELKAESPDGTVNTLGDLFKVFQGYADSRKIANDLQWANIPNRPTAPIVLGYSAIQRVTMADISWTYTGGTIFSRTKTLKQICGIAEATPITIVDMHFVAHMFTDIYGQQTAVRIISAIDVGLNPRTSV